MSSPTKKISSNFFWEKPIKVCEKCNRSLPKNYYLVTSLQNFNKSYVSFSFAVTRGVIVYCLLAASDLIIKDFIYHFFPVFRQVDILLSLVVVYFLYKLAKSKFHEFCYHRFQNDTDIKIVNSKTPEILIILLLSYLSYILA